MTTYPSLIDRSSIIDALSTLRREWADAAKGESLLQVSGNVGLLLSDIALALGLNTLEQIQVFGAELAHELHEALVTPGSNGH